MGGNNLEILIPDIEGWAIVKYHLNNDNDNEVCAEHVEGCEDGGGFNGGIARWCWLYTDTCNSKGINTCYVCEQPVPDSVVALVALAEWE